MPATSESVEIRLREALDLARENKRDMSSDKHSLAPTRFRLPSSFKPGAADGEVRFTSTGIEVIVNGAKRTISFDT